MTDIIVVNLDETDVVLESVRRLLKERHRVIVVDNGSEDAHRLAKCEADGAEVIYMKENKGVSVARNTGLDRSTASHVFLLDGDILYVPGTIGALKGIMAGLADAGCVGVHNVERPHGTKRREEADVRFPLGAGPAYRDFDMAWTQYGLFDGKMLRTLRFITEGAFGEAGNGFEDDMLWHDMERNGYKSYYVSGILYYHEAHGGQRWLDRKEMDNRNAERKALFLAKGGKPWNQKPYHQDYLRDTARA